MDYGSPYGVILLLCTVSMKWRYKICSYAGLWLPTFMTHYQNDKM